MAKPITSNPNDPNAMHWNLKWNKLLNICFLHPIFVGDTKLKKIKKYIFKMAKEWHGKYTVGGDGFNLTISKQLFSSLFIKYSSTEKKNQNYNYF